MYAIASATEKEGYTQAQNKKKNVKMEKQMSRNEEEGDEDDEEEKNIVYETHEECL